MKNYLNEDLVSVEYGIINLIPSNINFILSDSLRILKLKNKNGKSRVIKLTRINNGLMVAPSIIKKYCEELKWLK